MKIRQAMKIIQRIGRPYSRLRLRKAMCVVMRWVRGIRRTWRRQ